MAANKFATMLHRNTNKITLTLVYALLEWVLIILLLLNSLFSYLIVKFADYFGLKRPCLWCSRLDHIFEPGKSKTFHRDLLCDAHASEVSKLGYCSNHRKLAESQDMCEDCMSSSQPDCHEWSRKFAFFPWMKQIGMVRDGDDVVAENGEEDLRCSCCGESLNCKFDPPCILIKPSWGVLDYTQKENLVIESGIDAHTDEGDHSDQSRSDFVTDHHEGDEQGIEGKTRNLMVYDVVDESSQIREEEAEAEAEAEAEVQAQARAQSEAQAVAEFACREIGADGEDDEKVCLVMEKEQEKEPIKEEILEVSKLDQPCEQQTLMEVSSSKHTSLQIPLQALEFYIDQDDCRLIPIQPTTNENKTKHKNKVMEENSGNQDLILDFDMDFNVQKGVEPIRETWHSLEESLPLLSSEKGKEVIKFAPVESVDIGENGDNSVIQEEEFGEFLAAKDFQQVAFTQATQTPSDSEDGEDKDENGQAITAMERGGPYLDVLQGTFSFSA